MKLLSILILTIPGREAFLQALIDRLQAQTTDELEIMIDARPDITIGEKRNHLVKSCTGLYCAFIDDDDMVSINYVSKHLELIKLTNKGIDGIGFKGIITMDGKNPQVFIHSAKNDWHETHNGSITTYYRPLNHLNVVKTYLRRAILFPEINHGEDFAQAVEMKQGIDPDKTLDITDEIMYFYNVRTGISTTTKRAAEIGQKL